MDLRENDANEVKVYEKSGKIEPEETKKKWKNTNFLDSFSFAVTGIKTAFAEERNMRKHAVSAFLVLVAGLVFKVSIVEWMMLALCVFLVITFEIVNSAIENVVDLASDYHFSMRAKKAKDMAAGAVLMVSTLAIIIGVLIFLPKVWALLF